MIRLLIPVIVILIAVLAGLIWAAINDRLARLQREIDDLRTEILFLRGELDLVKRDEIDR